MTATKLIVSSLLIAVVLFLFSGLSQLFPWGVPTTQVVTARAEQQEIFSSDAVVQEYEVHSLTTPKFEEVFANKISTLSTDDTFSWIISTDIQNWQPAHYFMKEALMVLLVGLFLSLILGMTIEWTPKKRLTLVFLAALMAGTATYGSQMNWWHVPFSFHGGMMLNLILSWSLAAWLSVALVLKSVPRL